MFGPRPYLVEVIRRQPQFDRDLGITLFVQRHQFLERISRNRRNMKAQEETVEKCIEFLSLREFVAGSYDGQKRRIDRFGTVVEHPLVEQRSAVNSGSHYWP